MLSNFVPLFSGCLLLSFSGIALRADVGFGKFLGRKKIELEVRQPAAVHLANASIAFAGDAANREYASILPALLASIDAEVMSNERTLVKKMNPKEADWTLFLRVTSYSVRPPQVVQNQAGTRTKNFNADAVRWVGSLSVVYEILDRKGVQHDSRRVNEQYDKVVSEQASSGGVHVPLVGRKKATSATEMTPRTVDDLRQILIDRVTKRIAEEIGNTSQRVEIKIAGGHDGFKEAYGFMEQQQWARARDIIENILRFSKPEDESYRLYNLGVTYEALAYESKSAKEQVANFFKAEELYNEAYKLNHKEHYFQETLGRIRHSMAKYRELQNQPAIIASTEKPVPPTPKPEPKEESSSRAAQPDSKPQPSGEPMTIETVIRLLKDGTPEQMVLESIERYQNFQIDPLDPATMKQMVGAKLSRRVMNAIRKRAGLPPLGPSAPTKSKPAAAAPAPQKK